MKPTQKATGVLVVDGHPAVRLGLREMLRGQASWVVVAEADGVRAAEQSLKQAEVALILLEIALPDGDGLVFLQGLRARGIRTPVLVYSGHAEQAYAPRALRAGANGYLMKTAGRSELLRAMARVRDGEVALSAGVQSQLLASYREGGFARGGEASFSPREFQVFCGLGQGASTEELARRLHVSVKTIETHRANIKRKLGLDSAAGLVAHAARWVERNDPFPDAGH